MQGRQRRGGTIAQQLTSSAKPCAGPAYRRCDAGRREDWAPRAALAPSPSPPAPAHTGPRAPRDCRGTDSVRRP
jgi:hypothetical protein